MSSSNLLELTLELTPDLVLDDLESLVAIAQVSRQCKACVYDAWKRIQGPASATDVEKYVSAEQGATLKWVTTPYCAAVGLNASDRHMINNVAVIYDTRKRRNTYPKRVVAFVAAKKLGGLHAVYHRISRQCERRDRKKLLHQQRTEKALTYVRGLIPSPAMYETFAQLLIRRYVSNGKGGMKIIGVRVKRLKHLLHNLRQHIPTYVDDITMWSDLASAWMLVEPYLFENVPLLMELQVMQWCVDRFY